MKAKCKERIVLKVGILDTSEAKQGKNIYYKCLICGDEILSTSNDNPACKCVNIYIDSDIHRLMVRDKTKIEIFECLQ